MTSWRNRGSMTSPLKALRQALPDYARDIKLNLGTLLGEDDALELSKSQKSGIAVASGLASRNSALTRAIEHDALLLIDETARTAAAIMAMTNVYYRAVI